jgi:hypothetical protein
MFYIMSGLGGNYFRFDYDEEDDCWYLESVGGTPKWATKFGTKGEANHAISASGYSDHEFLIIEVGDE